LDAVVQEAETGQVPDARPRVPLISLIVPVFNEEDAVLPFIETTEPILKATGCPYEFVFIDDGSRDATVARLRALRMDRPQIRLIALSRNFGKEAAVTAGLDHAKGDVVIPMDVDLQDPPELIPEFLKHWRDGYLVVYGARADRRSDSFSKRLTAAGFYKIFNRISNMPIPFDAGDFRLLDRRVVEEIKKLKETNRFLKGIMAWPGFKTIGVPYSRPERAHGKSRFNYWKLWNFALDGLTSFTTLPLRMWTYIGWGLALFSMIFAIWIVLRTLIHGVDVPGYASLMVVVLFLGGMQLMSLGIIGEYVGRLYMETKQRPIYVIDRIDE
jgi:glycosyltransferase involved in cell wall biosynthesis